MIPAFWMDVRNLTGQPIWMFLAEEQRTVGIFLLITATLPVNMCPSSAVLLSYSAAFILECADSLAF